MNLNQLLSLLRNLTPPIVWQALRQPRSAAYRESRRQVQGDAYLAWLCVVVGGWLEADHGNVYAMEHALRHMPDGGAVIEIGTFLGRSACALTYLAHRHGRTNPLFICDPWVFEETAEKVGGFFNAATPEYAAYAREVFKLNLATFSGHYPTHAVEAFSTDFLRDWNAGKTVPDVYGRPAQLGGPISFAYIDGAHTYEATRADFLGVHAHLQPGGFVLFDDSSRFAGFGSVRAAQEVRQRPDYELVFAAPNYFFRRRS